ncbi:hypothetical protein [Paracoccus sp. SM22M-07]|uniref:hypothetical protein n=1 Tax=Paracoccus sp. SM22M-07 TaxID=1520813 RepID=UPI00091DC3A9|nr:hypothetical protein [Paracoccus sp. SM22M-07]OJH46156.1 hypothetical protein IE00_02790 [Paracoccus sp. SM22M-07]
MTRPNLIPLALLRELAAVVPDPMRPAQFVDLAEMMVGRSQPVASLPSPAAAVPVPDVATTPDKKGLPWTIEELERARAMLNDGKGPSEIARHLGRPVAATQIAIKRYGVRGDAPIIVPGRPTGRFLPNVVSIPPVPEAGKSSERGRFAGVNPEDRKADIRSDAWTDDDRAQLSKMKAAGKSLPEIATALGRSSEACRGQLKVMRGANVPVASASATWTEEEGRRLLAARAKGVPFKVIAEELGRTVRACEQRMTKLAKLSPSSPADVTPPKRNESASPVAVKAPTPAPVTKAPASFVSSPAPKEAVKADDAQLRAPLNEKQRRIFDSLCKLSDDFEPEDDLLLAEGVIGRQALELIADELGCETKDVKNRWKAMMFEDVVDWRGHPTIGGQSDLLTALRARIQSGEAANG